MKKILSVLLICITCLTLHAQNEKDLVITESKDFTWTLQEIVNPLGYTSIKFPRGRYIIYRDKKHPFGYVTLNVKSGEKKEKSVNFSMVKPFKVRGINWGSNCTDGNCCGAGLSCLTRRDDDFPASITPIYKDSALVQIELAFLADRKTGGGVSDPQPQAFQIPPITGGVGLEFGRHSSGDCGQRGLCKLHITVTFGQGMVFFENGQLNLCIDPKTISKEVYEKQFGDGSFLMEEDFPVSEDILKALQYDQPYTISAGKKEFKIEELQSANEPKRVRGWIRIILTRK